MKAKTERIYALLFALFCFSIPFSQFGEAIPNIAAIPLIGLFPFVLNLKEIKKSLDRLALAFLVILAIILLETLIFSRWEDFKFFTKILVVPLVYLLSIPIKNKNNSLLAFLLGACTLMFLSYFRVLGYIFQSDGFDFSVGKFINEILLGDRPYVGFVYVLGVLLSAYFFLQKKKIWLKGLFLLSGVLFLSLILIISARLSMLTLFFLGFLSFFFTKKWKLSLLFIVGFLFSVFLLFKYNPNFIDRFYAGYKEKNYTLEKALVMEPRYHIWDCAGDIVKNENTFWKGIGFQNTIEHLVKCYKTHNNFKSEEHREYFINSRFNTHNQFLGTYLGSGFFAVVLLSLFFILAFFRSRKNYFAFASIVALFLFCLVENVLSRQMGCLLFGFVWVIAYAFQDKSKSDSA